jgi:hypothetical protein
MLRGVYELRADAGRSKLETLPVTKHQLGLSRLTTAMRRDTACFNSVMQASVYRLRERGVKLPRPQQFVAGQLLLTKGLDSANRVTLKAQLLDGNGRIALPSLEGAAVRRITANGIVITGTEIIARRHGFKILGGFLAADLVVHGAHGGDGRGDHRRIRGADAAAIGDRVLNLLALIPDRRLVACLAE